MDEIRCSVAMATYNGEKYIKEQLDSIMANLTEQDELVISDDNSTDQTRNIIRSYQMKDERIKLVDGPQCGVIANFENAILNLSGRYIFLCDQDDVWELHKIERVLQCFYEHDCQVVIHDAEVWNEKEEVIIPSFISYRASKSGAVKNIIKNSYIGCCMAFKRELLDYILPIPKNIEMHDQWIGVIADIKAQTCFLNEILLHYRRHNENVSSMKHYTIVKMLKNRLVFVYELTKRLFVVFCLGTKR